MEGHDYSDWINQLTAKHPSESEKEYYNRLFAMKLGVELEFYKTRCVGCEHYTKNACTNFHKELTDEQAYTPHDCNAHSMPIPF